MILNSTYAFVTLALKVLICIQGSYRLTHDTTYGNGVLEKR